MFSNFVKAVFCKSEALFNMCYFEYALLGYQKGHRLAPDNEGFKLGIIKCKKTIMGTLSEEAFDFEFALGCFGLAVFLDDCVDVTLCFLLLISRNASSPSLFVFVLIYPFVEELNLSSLTLFPG